MRITRPLAAMNGMRFFFASTSRPCRDFDRAKPVPHVAAIAGTKIHRPGKTMSLFTWATASNDPRNSTNRVDTKNAAIVSVATTAAMK